MNRKAWTINVTLIVEINNSDGVPPTMEELQNIFNVRGFEMAMPRREGDPFVLQVKKV